MKYLCIFAVFLCIGCSSKPDTVEIKQDTIRRAPDVAMVKCEDLKPLESGDFESVSLKLQEISGLYYKCEAKRQSLQDFIENK